MISEVYVWSMFENFHRWLCSGFLYLRINPLANMIWKHYHKDFLDNNHRCLVLFGWQLTLCPFSLPNIHPLISNNTPSLGSSGYLLYLPAPATCSQGRLRCMVWAIGQSEIPPWRNRPPSIPLISFFTKPRLCYCRQYPMKRTKLILIISKLRFQFIDLTDTD